MKIGVVACSKSKAAEPCTADRLYTGRVFRAATELLRMWGCERLVILSALHGAVADDAYLAPYERSFASMDAATRRHWTVVARARLSNVLVEIAGSLDAADVHAIVPAAYAGALEGLPRVTRHFSGLAQGRLYAALSEAKRRLTEDGAAWRS